MPLFLAVLLVNQVNGTLGNPRFYIGQLRQADIYNFIYDDLAPAALDQYDGDLGEDAPKYDILRLKSRALAVARQTLPPEWLQAQMEQTISEVLPYMLGDTEEFSVTIPLKERVKAGSQAIKSNFLEKETFATIYDPTVVWAVDKGLANLDKLPYKIKLTRGELDSSLRTLLPQDWLLAQANGSLDAVVPYVTGEAEHFTVRIPLQDRVEAAKTVAVRILSKPETYDFIMDEVVAPTIEDSVGQTVPLPFGISVTQAEVVAAVRGVLPQPWVADRLTDVINQSALYIQGRSNTIAIVVPLAERKAAVIQVVSDLADAKLKALYDGLPQCTPQDLLRGVVVGGIPQCRPAGMSYDQAKSALGLDMRQTVTQQIGGLLPDQWTFTEADLRQALGEDAWDVVGKARDRVVNGWTFTDSDLRKQLGDRASTLDDVRDWIGNGFTFTQQDLRDRIMEGDNGDQALRDFDNARDQLGSARGLLFLLWGIPLILLVGIGFLGGRNWSSRLAWVAAVLGTGAAIAFISSGPVYSFAARPEIQSALAEATADVEGVTAQLAAEKGISMALNVADTFANGLRTKALLTLLLAGAGVAGAVVLARRGASGHREGQPPASPPQA